MAARTAGRVFRRTVAPRVVEQHSRRCLLSLGTARRCTCSPSYDASVKRDGRRVRGTFVTLAEAVAWAEATRDAARRGEPLVAARGPMPTLRDLAVSFLHRAAAGQALTCSRKRYAANTIRIYENMLRLRILPHRDSPSGVDLGDLPASAVDTRAAQRLIDELAAGPSRVLARHTACALSAVLRDGYARGLLDTLPPRLLLPPPPPRRERVLTPTEAESLRVAAQTDDVARRRSLYGPLVGLLCETGCRLGEALGLAWGADGLDLDVKPPTVRIARSTTKTEAGARDVPLADATAAILRRHYLALGRPPHGSPVFPDKAGKPRRRGGFVYESLDRIAEAAGLADVTPHVLRHSHATWLAATGVPPAAAAARLGHSDGGALFLRVYAHPGKSEAAAALDAVTAYRAAACADATERTGLITG